MLRSLFASLSLLAVVCAQSPVVSTFTGGLVISNPGPAAATMYFDVNVVDPAGIMVTQFDCNINTTSGTTGTLGVWITGLGGTHVGATTTASLWTQVGTATRTHTGGRTSFLLQTPFYLAPGTRGMALHHVGMNPVYTNPATPVPPLPTTYSTAEVTLNMTVARSRTSTVLDPFGGTAAGNSPRHANIAMFYVSGSVAVDFSGTPTRGASPLTVQFTSNAASGNPGGIIAYSWDFDGDSVPDSNAVHPQWTYVACGNYTVSLTIFDSVGATTASKTNYVRTDIIVPSFTNTIIGPNVVQFTDTSSPTPATWAWDLDGDSIVDSNAQHPLFVYPNACGEVNVTLTTTLACQPTVTLTKRIAVASTIETSFAGGLVTTTTATGGVNFIDVAVANPLGITVCAMHVNSNVPNLSPLTINVWQKEGTYVGALTDPTLWRLVGTSTVTSRGPNARTFVPFTSPIHLAAGAHGLGIEHVGASPMYTNSGVPLTFSNADVAITAGLTQSSPIFAATSTTFSPRIWNGAIHYATSSSTGAAGYGYIGAGCPGSLGIPTNVTTSQPVLGGAANITIDRLPFGIGVMILGMVRFPVPVDLVIIGMPGCPLRVSPDVTATIVGAPTTASMVFPVPNVPALIGVQVYTQALGLDLGLNPFGFSISDAAVMLVGQ
ncbi:MAG TPA: PKD domain-containing protein [Planctomycetota bacterium]